METEMLNEYLFADLVSKWADGARDERLRRQGAAPDAIEAPTDADLREGFRHLQARRIAVLKILRESGQSPQ